MSLPPFRFAVRLFHPALVLAAAALLAAGPLAAASANPAAAQEETPAIADFEPGTPNPEAPPETADGFGRLVGVWDVAMSTRGEDGSWPETPNVRAEWRFEYALDGWAIQDHWTSPPPEEPVEGVRQRGTNIRIYDPEAEHWDVGWISNTQQKLSTLEAVVEDGRIVMTGAHASGRPSRVTFHDITDDSFDWRLELQGVGEDPEAWTELARIRAERRE